MGSVAADPDRVSITLIRASARPLASIAADERPAPTIQSNPQRHVTLNMQRHRGPRQPQEGPRDDTWLARSPSTAGQPVLAGTARLPPVVAAHRFGHSFQLALARQPGWSSGRRPRQGGLCSREPPRSCGGGVSVRSPTGHAVGGSCIRRSPTTGRHAIPRHWEGGRLGHAEIPVPFDSPENPCTGQHHHSEVCRHGYDRTLTQHQGGPTVERDGQGRSPKRASSPTSHRRPTPSSARIRFTDHPWATWRACR